MGEKHTKILLSSFIFVFVALAGLSFAAQLEQKADPLNYYANTTHNITLKYTGAVPGVTINATYPTGYAVVSTSSGCQDFPAARNVSCTLVNPNDVKSYTVTHSATTTEYDLSIFSAIVTTTAQAAADIKLVNISSTDVMDTLIELGRGRGAYIYSTRYGGSFQDNGTTFIPANTRTQLWYLHRIYNIGHYLGLSEEGQSLDVDCNYKDLPVVSKHPVDSTIAKSGGRWTVNYTADGGVGTSFWKMIWTSIETQTVGSQVLNDGDSIYGNCTQASYTLSTGTVRASYDLANLTAATTTPLTITASPSNATVYLGQSENMITYTITNAGRYKVAQLQIEIEAPQYARWIGTRGEIFGTSVEKYVFELPELAAGESTLVELAARFDVPNSATDASTITLGVWDAKFFPPWELIAYSPIRLEQNDNTIAGTVTVNLNSTTTITAVRGATDTIIAELGKIREFLDELAFLVTDSVGGGPGAPSGNEGTDQASTTSSGSQKSGASFTGGTTIQVTQTLVNNAWLIMLLVAIGVAGYLIIGGKANYGNGRSRSSSNVIYKPMIHG